MTRDMQIRISSSPVEGLSIGATGDRATSVDLVTDERAFFGLRSSWNEIAERRPDLSVFGWHEWFDAAWQWRKNSCRLHVLTWSDRGQIKAILPMLMAIDATCLREFRVLSFLTVPDTQFCDVLVAESDRARAVAAFASYLASRQTDWDVMRLEYLRPGAVAATTLASAMATAGYAVTHAASPGNPYISLEGTWTTYYSARSRRLKKSSNLAANRLAKAGDVRIERFTPDPGNPEHLAQLIDWLIDVSRNSWKSGTGTTLDQPGPCAFVRRLSEVAAARGWLSVWLLTLDGCPLATEYQLVHNGNVHALRSDFHQRFEEISPGSHLNRAMLELLFGSGTRRYFMGPGNNAYKYRWAEGAEPQALVTIYSRSIGGRVLSAWEQRLKPWASAMRARLASHSAVVPESEDD